MCDLPFQCAHGRPSMVPLVEVGEGLGVGVGGMSLLPIREVASDERGFGQSWKAWGGDSL